MLYKLNEKHEPVQISLDEFLAKEAMLTQQVARDTVDHEVRVSTVFLCINHQSSDGPPILFETMIFGGPHNQEQFRWHTWHEALAGHIKIVEQLRCELNDEQFFAA